MGQSYSHLSAEERAAIMLGKSGGASARAIAVLLGRAPSTIARELARNGHRERGRTGTRRPAPGYDATRAGHRARRLATRARRMRKLVLDSPLWRCVHRLLIKRFSPRQISRTLRRHHPDEPAWHVSHETIYSAIYAAPRGALRQGLVALLRQHKCARRPRGQGRGPTRTHARSAELSRSSARSERTTAARPLGRRLHQGRAQPVVRRRTGRSQDAVRQAREDGRVLG